MMIKHFSQYLCLACSLCLISSCQFIQTINSENDSELEADETFSTQNTSQHATAMSHLSSNVSPHDILFNEISGWNHVSYYPEEFKQLRLLSSAYHINATELTIGNQKHLEVSTVLVRKLANWERQHSNGIEINLASKNVTFGNFKTLDFGLVINAKKSVIPSIDRAVDHFSAEINANSIDDQWLEELLVEPAKITFTFVGEGHGGAQVKTAIASYRYLVSDVDEAVNLSITQADLAFYWQQNYQQQQSSLTDLSGEKIVGMIVTLDTGNNKNLRQYINEAGQHKFPQDMKELFVELDLTIRDPKITTTSIY